MTSIRDAFATVDRAPFIPDTIYVRDERGWLIPLRRAEAPDLWRAHVQEDAPVVTAVAPDPRAPAHILDSATGRGYVSISSSTEPRLMARMLDALELEAGLRVLEIGTGTGYNAALLAHLVGAANVTSMEIDAMLAERARVALDAAGHAVRVVTGDGAAGWPDGAPYDRVIVTAAAESVADAWVKQTRPGGRLVVPWSVEVHPDAPLGVVTVTEDGSCETEFHGPAPFMPLRAPASP